MSQGQLSRKFVVLVIGKLFCVPCYGEVGMVPQCLKPWHSLTQEPELRFEKVTGAVLKELDPGMPPTEPATTPSNETGIVTHGKQLTPRP